MKQLQVWSQSNQIKEIKEIYGKNLTDGEFSILCEIGKTTNLNPFMREIWAVKYGSNPANIFIGRDGYRKAAQDNPEYDYHIVDAVYSNDDFKIEHGEVVHGYAPIPRGELVGAYCSIKRRSSSKPIFIYVDRSEYDTKRSVWKDKPATMIKKVAEAQGLRMAFQSMFAGTYDESEQWEEKTPVKNKTKKAKVTEVKEPEQENIKHFKYAGCEKDMIPVIKERLAAGYSHMEIIEKMKNGGIIITKADEIEICKIEIKAPQPPAFEEITPVKEKPVAPKTSPAKSFIAEQIARLNNAKTLSSFNNIGKKITDEMMSNPDLSSNERYSELETLLLAKKKELSDTSDKNNLDI